MKLRRVGSRSFVLAALAAFAAPAVAAIVTLGDVSPNPVTPVVIGTVRVGQSTIGQLDVDAGSSVVADTLLLGTGLTGNGRMTVVGSGTSVLIGPVVRGGVNVGSQGRGEMTISGGGSLHYGSDSTDCLINCLFYVTNGAGSFGTLSVSGVGSSLTTTGLISVGNAAVFTVAADGFDFGVPGGSSDAFLNVTAGATGRSSILRIAQTGGGAGRTGTEVANGSMVLEGAGTRWDVVRNREAIGDISLVRLASSINSNGRLDVTGGAKLALDGSAAPSSFSGINLASGGAGARAEMLIDGAGSHIELTGGLGFVNIGTNLAGGAGRVNISGGGRIAGVGDSGLLSVSVGRNGASGDLVVQGHDAAGNASLLRINGYNTVTGGGSFFGTGRAGSVGTTAVLAGGRIELDTSAFTLSNPDALSALFVGDGIGGMGSLTISGRNAVSGVPSTVAVTGGLGLNPYAVVGRDGGTGNLTISEGGRLVMQGNSASAAAAPGSGERLFLEIGDRFGAGSTVSTGTVTVTGAGSLLALSGAADRFVSVANNLNAVGTLNITAGGRVESLAMLVGTGTGASGVLNMNGGTVSLSGVHAGGATAGTGGGLGVGNGASTGVASLAGGSVFEVNSTAPRAGVVIGGVTSVVGGNGTINVTEASRITVSSADALVYVGNTGTAAVPAVATLNVRDPGSLVETIGIGAHIIAGRNAFTTGTIDIGAGAQIRSTDLIGIAHDGTASTLGTGTLCVDGTATAPRIINGANGLICGSGTLVGDVTNLGTLSPGRSPSRIRIEGIFDTQGGRIILEVERVAGGRVGIVGGAIHIGGSEFHVDEIVITDFDLANFGDVEIVFSFLGLTSPEEFEDSGEWNLSTFFLEGDGAGGVKPIDDADLDKFSEAVFSARADRYEFTSFSFTPRGGPEFTVSFIPVPPTWLLMLPAIVAMVVRRRR